MSTDKTKEGTLLRYRGGGRSIGKVVTDAYGLKAFVDLNPNAKMIGWVINEWSMYEIVSEAEATLYILENA